MRPVRVLLPVGFGLNCEEETAAAFACVGASPEKVHLKQLIHQCPEEMRRDLDGMGIPCHLIPGNMDTGNKHTRRTGRCASTSTRRLIIRTSLRVFWRTTTNPALPPHLNLPFTGPPR